MVKKKGSKKYLFGMTEADFSRENVIEGAFIRPGVLMLSFIGFLAGIFLILSQNLKWGGSAIVFSFVVTLYSIYQSLGDEPSVFKNLNLVFKFGLFLAEIIALGYVLPPFM